MTPQFLEGSPPQEEDLRSGRLHVFESGENLFPLPFRKGCPGRDGRVDRAKLGREIGEFTPYDFRLFRNRGRIDLEPETAKEALLGQ